MSALKGLYYVGIFRTILVGAGVVGGDWEKDDYINKKMLFIIEPVVESLLQVGNEF